MLTKRGKYYWLDIRIKGKRIRRTLKTTKKPVALIRASEMAEQLLAEHYVGKISFSDFCKKYLDWAWSSKPASALREEQRLEKIKDFFNELDILYLDDITPYHIEQLKTKLRENDLAKSTINRYLQILRGMFYKAIDWEIYRKPNPLKKIKFFREDNSVQPLSNEDVRKILVAAKEISKQPNSHLQQIFHDIVILALNTGMRKSEILNLKWEDFKGGEILVRGKGDKARSVPLNSMAEAVVINQPRKTEYIFDIPNRHQPDLFRRTVAQIRKRIKVDFHFHLLRHYFTTKLIEKGIDFVTVGELLGHSKISTSLIYSHTNKERKKRAVELLMIF